MSKGEAKMPQKKAALKEIKQNQKRELRNKGLKTELKTIIKKLQSYINKGDKEKIEGMYRLFASKLDKACKKGVVKLNTASRKKSRMAKKIAALQKS